MSSLSNKEDFVRAHDCALKILNNFSTNIDGRDNKEVFQKLTNKELDDAILYFSEVLHRVSEETSERKNASVSIHVDYIPEEQ